MLLLPMKCLRVIGLLITLTLGAFACSSQNGAENADADSENTPSNASIDATKDKTAYVAIAANALKGGMKIVAVDGIPVQQMNGVDLPAGDHQISVACKLDNGISTTFAFDVSLEPDHSYCFFSQNPGKACSIVYTKIGWKGAGIVSCR